MFLQLIFFPHPECRSVFPVTPVVDCRGPACVFFLKMNNGLGLCCVFLRGLVLDTEKKGAGVQQSELAAL